ncbi:hypothetical protein GCM10023187_57460 [Nibrella viscosa]|uniref:Lipocalin-like domain-containing protein n=1 Tax=Nibrella viscosa TaxID=1084524 RepID=A0ABP8L3K4_9BACT
MKPYLVFTCIAAIVTVFGCRSKQPDLPLIGTWELISATTTVNDSTFSTFDSAHKMIKIINPTHFAFLNHTTNREKDSSATAFTAGGGTYTLADSVYTENLEYFSDKNWENHQFRFVVKIVNDTLIQTGVEKLEKLGIDHVIVEKYKRVTQ